MILCCQLFPVCTVMAMNHSLNLSWLFPPIFPPILRLAGKAVQVPRSRDHAVAVWPRKLLAHWAGFLLHFPQNIQNIEFEAFTLLAFFNLIYVVLHIIFFANLNSKLTSHGIIGAFLACRVATDWQKKRKKTEMTWLFFQVPKVTPLPRY